MRQEEFGKALERKDFASAWDISNNVWYGSARMRQAVLYEMLQTILKEGEKQK